MSAIKGVDCSGVSTRRELTVMQKLNGRFASRSNYELSGKTVVIYQEVRHLITLSTVGSMS